MQLQMPLTSSPNRGPLTPLIKPTPVLLKRARRLTISAVAATRPTTTSATSMYELLSVPETAGPQEIKAAYRRQARRWHPDTCSATSDKGLYAHQFMKVREAYEVLSDPVLREDYDLALRAGVGASGWAAAAFCEGEHRSRARWRRGSGDWGSQLEGLKRRSASPSAATPATWGSKMRGAGDRPVPAV